MVKVPCENCKKKIESNATICPYCQTHFTSEQMKTRKDSVKFGCIALIVIGLAIWLFTSCSEDEKPSTDDATVVAEKTVTSDTVDLTDKQQTAVDYARSIMMQTVSCEATIDQVQGEMDKMGRGEKSLVDGYSSLRFSLDSCQGDLKLLKETNFENIKEPEAVAIGKQALASCAEATKKRADALKKLTTFLKGSGDLDLAADYKAGVRSAANDHAACKLTLAGLPAFYKVPESEVHFLKF